MQKKRKRRKNKIVDTATALNEQLLRCTTFESKSIKTVSQLHDKYYALPLVSLYCIQDGYFGVCVYNAILLKCGGFLKSEIIQEITISTIRLIRVWATLYTGSPRFQSFAYAIYNTLLLEMQACRLIYTENPYLSASLALFTAISSDNTSSPRLSWFCEKALLSCESYLHPRSAPMYIPAAHSIQKTELTLLSHSTLKKRQQEFQQQLARMKIEISEQCKKKFDEDIQEIQYEHKKELIKQKTLINDLEGHIQDLKRRLSVADAITDEYPSKSTISEKFTTPRKPILHDSSDFEFMDMDNSVLGTEQQPQIDLRSEYIDSNRSEQYSTVESINLSSNSMDNGEMDTISIDSADPEEGVDFSLLDDL